VSLKRAKMWTPMLTNKQKRILFCQEHSLSLNPEGNTPPREGLGNVARWADTPWGRAPLAHGTPCNTQSNRLLLSIRLERGHVED
jgi:hypothetical protein